MDRWTHYAIELSLSPPTATLVVDGKRGDPVPQKVTGKPYGATFSVGAGVTDPDNAATIAYDDITFDGP